MIELTYDEIGNEEKQGEDEEDKASNGSEPLIVV